MHATLECKCTMTLVSVLGPVSCRFYSFVVLQLHDFFPFLFFFKCIYVDVCLRKCKSVL